MPNAREQRTPKVLTADDVLARLSEVLASGWGELKVTVQAGYIHTLHKSITEQGVKPQ